VSSRWGAGKETFDDQIGAVQASPGHEVPACSVPQSTEDHCGHEVELRAGRATTVAAHRYVQIVAEPGRQADVPEAPEFSDTGREIRSFEVPHQANSEHSSSAARHVGVAGEIEVDLKAEGVEAPQQRPAGSLARIGEGGVGQWREDVAQ
jgi:hypothetical protein